MAVYFTCPIGVSFDFQLHAVCCVHETGAAAMHFLAGHGAQIDQKPELVVGVELLKGHELGFVFFFHEEAAHFTPNVPTFDAVVVYHVGRAVYREADFLYVREDVVFRISCPAAYDSINSKRIPFNDRLWALTLMFVVAVSLSIGTTLSRLTWSYKKTLCLWCKLWLPLLQGTYFRSFHTQAGCSSAYISVWSGPCL